MDETETRMKQPLAQAVAKAHHAMRDLFGATIERTRLQIHNEESWCASRPTDVLLPHTTGYFDPIRMRAHLRSSSEHFIPDAFHEIYGHGFLLEQSPIGKLFHSQTAADLQTLLASDRHAPYGIVNSLRENLEAFAHWLEATLCEQTGYADAWKRKEHSLPIVAQALYAHATTTHKRLTTLGFAKQYGIPMQPDKNALATLLRTNFPIDTANGDLAILHGSRRPASDIDVLIVTDAWEGNAYWGWLDTYVLSHEKFQQACSRLELHVTDPILDGELVLGDEHRYAQVKEYLRHAPITSESVQTARQSEQEHARYLIDAPTERHPKGNSYVQAYRTHAALLEQGRKTLTLREIHTILL